MFIGFSVRLLSSPFGSLACVNRLLPYSFPRLTVCSRYDWKRNESFDLKKKGNCRKGEERLPAEGRSRARPIVGDITSIIAYPRVRISNLRRSLQSCPTDLTAKPTQTEVRTS